VSGDLYQPLGSLIDAYRRDGAGFAATMVRRAHHLPAANRLERLRRLCRGERYSQLHRAHEGHPAVGVRLLVDMRATIPGVPVRKKLAPCQTNPPGTCEAGY
jgi:hypothetical protein